MIQELKYNEVHDAQQHFRQLLDAYARPGKINQLPTENINPPNELNASGALIGFSLLNTDVSFFSAKNQEQINQYFIMNCASSPSTLEEADFIFMNGSSSVEYIKLAKTGQPEYPENSACLIIDVDIISDNSIDRALEISLKGPGVNGTKSIFIDGLNPELLKVITEKNIEFPMGIETVITDKHGNFMAIPRSSKIDWNVLKK